MERLRSGCKLDPGFGDRHTDLLPTALAVQVPVPTLPDKTVLRIRDPGSGAFLTPGPGSRIRNRFFFTDPRSRIPDPKPIFLRA
jgi:hypothetical protein